MSNASNPHARRRSHFIKLIDPLFTCRRIADVCGTFGVGERLLLAFRRDTYN